MPSMITMAVSTRIPRAMTSENSVRLLRLSPIAFITMKVVSNVRGMEIAARMPSARPSARKRMTTIIRIVCQPLEVRMPRSVRMNSELSLLTVISMSGSSSNSAILAFALSTTAMMFELVSLKT